MEFAFYVELIGNNETIDKQSRVMDSIKTVTGLNYHYFICH